MSPHEKIVRGRQAAWLLDQEAFREVLDACLVHCQMLWANTAPDDPNSRELLFQQFTAVHSLEEMLKNFVEDGARAMRETNGDTTRSN
jgi:hypothetical protein